jgi:hypothetical protein
LIECTYNMAVAFPQSQKLGWGEVDVLMPLMI